MLRYYKKLVGTIPLNPIVRKMGLPVHQLCVEVEMTQDEKYLQNNPEAIKNTENKPIKSCRDLLYRDENLAKRIFLRGKAGYGKTCYALRLVNTWRNAWLQRQKKEKQRLPNVEQDDDETIPNVDQDDDQTIPKVEQDDDMDDVILQFDFVFYVAFRFLEKEHESVVDIVCKDYFLSNTKQSQNLRSNVEIVLRSSHYKCLVILDGLDESKLSDLPVQGHMENYQLLYTSRPSKLDVIDPEYDQDDKVVDILGLGDDLSELVENILGQYYKIEGAEYREKYISVMNKLESISNQQRDFLKIPILAPYIIVQIHEDKECVLTESLTTAYLGIFNMLITKAKKHNRLPYTMLEKFKEKKVCSSHFNSECRHPLFKLGELAYNDLVDSACLVFKGQTLDKLGGDVIKFAINAGFICQTNVIGSTKGETSANFLHKSMQEFLAAFYLTCNKKVFDKFLNGHLDTIEKYINMSEVCAFLSGLKPEFGLEMSKRIVKLANADEGVRKRRRRLLNGDLTYSDTDVLHRLSYIQCKCCREFIAAKRDYNSPITDVVISEVSEEYNTREDKFSITDVVITKDSEEYIRYLIDDKTTCHTMINLRGTKHGYESFQSIFRKDKDRKQICTCMNSESDVNEIITNSSLLDTLFLSQLSFKTNCALHPRPVSNKCISWPSTLSVLSIKDVTFQRDTYCALNKFLSNDNGLTVLQLYCVETEHDSQKGFCISGCKNLQKLILGRKFSFSGRGRWSRKDNSAYPAINRLLSGDNALQVLHINGVKTNDDGGEGISISGCKKLNELCCRNICVSYIDLTHCSKLSTIKLVDLYMKNQSPYNRDPLKLEIIFPESTDEEGLASESSQQGYVGKENVPSGVILLPRKNQLRKLQISNVKIRQKINLTPFTNLKKLTFVQVVMPHNEQSRSLCYGEVSMHELNLANNKELTNVELGFSTNDQKMTYANINPTMNENKKLPMEITLPQDSQVQCLALKNVRLEKLDIKHITQLQTLILNDVSVFEISLPVNTELVHVDMNNSFISHIDSEKVVSIRDVSLGFMSSTNEFIPQRRSRFRRQSTLDSILTLQMVINLQIIDIQNLSINNISFDNLDLSLVTNSNLRTLILKGIDMPVLDFSPKAEITTLDVSDSCIRQLNLLNAVKLSFVTLGFVSPAIKSRSTSIDERKPLVEDITLPNSPCLQQLTIKNATIPKLDMFTVHNLRQLSLHGVTISDIDMSNNTELTDLYVIASSISHFNLTNAVKLSAVILIFGLTSEHVFMDESSIWSNTTATKWPKPVDITFLNSSRGESVEEENIHLSEVSLQQSTEQNINENTASLAVSLPSKNNIRELTIENAILEKVNFTPFIHLEKLNLQRVVSTEIVLSHKKQMTDFCLTESYIKRLYFKNNTQLARVQLAYSNAIRKEIYEVEERRLPMMRHLSHSKEEDKTHLTVEIHLLHSPEIQYLKIADAKLEQLELSCITHLRVVHLDNVTIPEIDFSHNRELIKVHVRNSCVRYVNVANILMLRDMHLCVGASTEKNISKLTLEYEKQQRSWPSTVPFQHNLTVPDETMSEKEKSKKEEYTTLYVGDSSMRYIDVANAAMLHDIHLSFEYFKNRFSVNIEDRDNDNDQVLPIAEEISLPHSPYLRILTIQRAYLQQLDLSPVPNLRKLTLLTVTMSEMNLDLSPVKDLGVLELSDVSLSTLDLDCNTKLTKLHMSNVCILNRLNLAHGSMLEDVKLEFMPSKVKRRCSEDHEDDDKEEQMQAEIKFPRSSNLQSLSIRNANIQTSDLSFFCNLTKLKLNGVYVSRLDLSNNAELTQLIVHRFARSNYEFYLSHVKQVYPQKNDMMKLDISQIKKLESLALSGIELTSSPDVRQASTVTLHDVQMDIEHWKEFADSLLSMRGECEVRLTKINDNNSVIDTLKRAGYSIENSKLFWVYPL